MSISCPSYGVEIEQFGGMIPPFNKSRLTLRFLGIFHTWLWQQLVFPFLAKMEEWKMRDLFNLDLEVATNTVKFYCWN